MPHIASSNDVSRQPAQARHLKSPSLEVLEPERNELAVEQSRRRYGLVGDCSGEVVSGDGVRELEPRLRVFGLPSQPLVKAGVLERDRRVAG